METYIEISFMHQFLTIAMSLHLARLCVFSFFSSKIIFLYSLLISLFSHLLWFPYSGWFILLLETFCFITFFQADKKLYVFAYAIRFLCMLSSFVLYQGSFYNLTYMPPTTAFIYPLWLFFGLIIMLCYSVCANHYIEENCIYPVTLILNHQILHLKGYLDSGNFASYQGKCIIFLDAKYVPYVTGSVIEKIVVHTMNQESIIDCVEAQLQFVSKKENVYVAFTNQLKLPNACPLLLNMRLLG